MRRSRLHNYWHLILGSALALLGGTVARLAYFLPDIYQGFLDRHVALRGPFLGANIASSMDFLCRAAQVVAAILIAAGLLGFLKRRVCLLIMRSACFAGWVLLFLYYHAVFRATAVVFEKNVVLDGVTPNPIILFLWRYNLLLPAILAGVALALGYLVSWRRTVISLYGGDDSNRPAPGDIIMENLRTHGRDPMYRKSLLGSIWTHVLIILVIPWLLSLRGMMTAYGVPKGSGQQGGQKVEVRRVVKKKARKKLMLNMNSPIIFHIPDLDESLIAEELVNETLNTYVASAVGGTGSGKLGKGGGKGGGWPDGMDDAKVRFIRLEYIGGDWDQDMGTGADYNFLLKFREITGFKIADNTEHIRIADLKRFPGKRAPPFVFITGRGNISVTPKDVQCLRWYCLEAGGMIFADNGGGNFNASLRALMARVFPDLTWVDIANDDILYRVPFVFPNGAPPLWHHSGTRALGMKYNGRWVVYYHQGDINDAWKTGHSGASPQLAEDAFRLGVNVVNYAFNQYMQLNYGN